MSVSASTSAARAAAKRNKRKFSNIEPFPQVHSTLLVPGTGLAKVKFDINNTPAMYWLLLWAQTTELASKEDVTRAFEFLKRSGAVLLSAATIPNPRDPRAEGFFESVLDHEETYWLDNVLSEPCLTPGWSIVNTEGQTPVYHVMLNHFDVKCDEKCARVVDVMTDNAINQSDRRGWTLLNLCMGKHNLLTLRKLLLRPSLNMNSRPNTIKFPIAFTSERYREIESVFREVASIFSTVPKLVQDSFHDRFALTLDLPVAQIIADYYRLPFPVGGLKALICLH